MARSPVVWFAEEGSIRVGNNIYSTQVKDISVTGGGRDIELIRTFGGGEIMNERPMEIMETRMTFVSYNPSKTASWVIGGSPAETGAVNISGDTLRNRITNGGVSYDWRDPTDLSGPGIRLHLGSPWGTSIEWSQNSDGQLEETVTFKCLPGDFKVQRTSNAADNPLSAP